jgi:mediator of RNA polymerase II transcription subunit 8
MRNKNRSSLQSQANIISNNLNTISSQLAEHHELLSSLVAYPGPSFPGRTQSGILEQLLRTKLDPRVEDWVTRGRSAGATTLKEQNGLSEEELAELWAWAPIEANQEARSRNWGGNFTLEERAMGIQNVVTGLKRQLEDEESEEEDEEEDEEDADEMEIVESQGNLEGAGVEDGQRIPSKSLEPALPLEEIFRFISTGANPKSATSS